MWVVVSKHLLLIYMPNLTELLAQLMIFLALAIVSCLLCCIYPVMKLTYFFSSAGLSHWIYFCNPHTVAVYH